MSTAIAKDQAALMKAEGKLKKLFKAVKKLFAKEFLWVLFIALLALPLALILNYVLTTYVSATIVTKLENMLKEILGDDTTFTGAYGVSVAGIYFTRTIIGSMKSLIDKPAS